MQLRYIFTKSYKKPIVGSMGSAIPSTEVDPCSMPARLVCRECTREYATITKHAVSYVLYF